MRGRLSRLLGIPRGTGRAEAGLQRLVHFYRKITCYLSHYTPGLHNQQYVYTRVIVVLSHRHIPRNTNTPHRHTTHKESCDAQPLPLSNQAKKALASLRKASRQRSAASWSTTETTDEEAGFNANSQRSAVVYCASCRGSIPDEMHAVHVSVPVCTKWLCCRPHSYTSPTGLLPNANQVAYGSSKVTSKMGVESRFRGAFTEKHVRAC